MYGVFLMTSNPELAFQMIVIDQKLRLKFEKGDFLILKTKVNLSEWKVRRVSHKANWRSF